MREKVRLDWFFTLERHLVSRTIARSRLQSLAGTAGGAEYASPAGVDSPNWPLINEELAIMLCSLHFELANKIITPSIAAEEAATLVNAHFDHHVVPMKPSTCCRRFGISMLESWLT